MYNIRKYEPVDVPDDRDIQKQGNFIVSLNELRWIFGKPSRVQEHPGTFDTTIFCGRRNNDIVVLWAQLDPTTDEDTPLPWAIWGSYNGYAGALVRFQDAVEYLRSAQMAQEVLHVLVPAEGVNPQRFKQAVEQLAWDLATAERESPMSDIWFTTEWSPSAERPAEIPPRRRYLWDQDSGDIGV